MKQHGQIITLFQPRLLVSFISFTGMLNLNEECFFNQLTRELGLLSTLLMIDDSTFLRHFKLRFREYFTYCFYRKLNTSSSNSIYNATYELLYLYYSTFTFNFPDILTSVSFVMQGFYQKWSIFTLWYHCFQFSKISEYVFQPVTLHNALTQITLLLRAYKILNNNKKWILRTKCHT